MSKKKNILCFFGIHNWEYDKNTIVKCNRTCKKCHKSQHSMYDMAYGVTYWVNGVYWYINEGGHENLNGSIELKSCPRNCHGSIIEGTCNVCGCKW